MKWNVTPKRWQQSCLGLGAILLGGPALFIACFTPPVPTQPSAGLPIPEQSYHLYVADWGYHTTIILQQPKGWRLGPENDPDAAFVEYSWGDRNFYMNADFSPPALFATVFLPTPSVLHLRNWSQAPTLSSGMRYLYHRHINAQQLRALINSLETSFETSRANVLPPVPRFRGRFYPGREYYIFWSACNAWTVNHLAQAGLARSGWPILIAAQVAPQLRGFKSLSSPRQ
jgi:hypothetical protein